MTTTASPTRSVTATINTISKAGGKNVIATSRKVGRDEVMADLTSETTAVVTTMYADGSAHIVVFRRAGSGEGWGGAIRTILLNADPTVPPIVREHIR